MMASETPDYIIEIDQNNAQQGLIQNSLEKLVVAVFYAPSQPATLTMVNHLEQIATDYQGDFVLAKLDVDQQAMIAGQLGIQQAPAVLVIQNGQPVNGFQGDKDYDAIVAFLSEYLPKPFERDLNSAKELIAANDFPSAITLLEKAELSGDSRADIVKLLAMAYLHENKLDNAETMLKKVKLADQDAEYEHLLADITLRRQSLKSPELDKLEQAFQQTPEDLNVALQLAIQYHHSQMNREACEILITILQKDKDFNQGEARKVLLDIFKAVGFKEPLVIEYQRKLFSLLY